MKNFFYIFFLTLFFFSYTEASTGYIDTSATNQAKVCYDNTCASSSIINFELSQQPSIVIDSVTGISGYVWGNSLGWIKLNPTGAGVTFANNQSGLLTGKAWSQVAGWINFAVTGQSVYISPTTGEFSGFAWTGGPYGGWIKFDCADSACVKTSWRANTSGGGGGGHPIDVCPNIDGIQSGIPTGYSVNNIGACVLVVDVCPNIDGDQKTIPKGFKKNEIDACVPTAIDFCPNISGLQNYVPKDYFVSSSGDCLKTPTDFCPNISGIQTSPSDCKDKAVDICFNLPGPQETVPLGFVLSQGSCIPSAFDICSNIEGEQPTVPEGYSLDEQGGCQRIPEDLCDNLSGSQVIVPKGFFKQGDSCFFAETNQEKTRVVSFSFVPSSLQSPSDSALLKKSISFVDSVFKTGLSKGDYKVDKVSFGVGLFGFVLIISLLVFTIKKAFFGW